MCLYRLKFLTLTRNIFFLKNTNFHRKRNENFYYVKHMQIQIYQVRMEPYANISKNCNVVQAREKNGFFSNFVLNRFRARAYLSASERVFKIVEWIYCLLLLIFLKRNIVNWFRIFFFVQAIIYLIHMHNMSFLANSITIYNFVIGPISYSF